MIVEPSTLADVATVAFGKILKIDGIPIMPPPSTCRIILVGLDGDACAFS